MQQPENSNRPSVCGIQLFGLAQESVTLSSGEVVRRNDVMNIPPYLEYLDEITQNYRAEALYLCGSEAERISAKKHIDTTKYAVVIELEGENLVTNFVIFMSTIPKNCVGSYHVDIVRKIDLQLYLFLWQHILYRDKNIRQEIAIRAHKREDTHPNSNWLRRIPITLAGAWRLLTR